MPPLNPDRNQNNVTERRKPSPRRDNDVPRGTLPCITKTAYDSLVRGNGADVNLEVKRLAQVKNLLGQAAQIADMLVSDYRKRESKQYPAMRQTAKNIDSAWERVPLTIENK